MRSDLHDKVALVTGGGSGIGRATALLFGREGAKIVVVDIKGGEETIQRIKAAGGEGIFVKADVSQPGDVEAMILKTVEQYGHLDCACNIAGINHAPVLTAGFTDETWNRVISVNLTGVQLCLKYELARMSKQGSGAIVNMSSGTGLVGVPGLSAYVASKHGVIGLTKTAALEYAAAGIRVNAICPGFIRTEMLSGRLEQNSGLEAQITAGIPMKRLGKPEEIAETAVWLCKDASSYITGHALVVDGGYIAA